MGIGVNNYRHRNSRRLRIGFTATIYQDFSYRSILHSIYLDTDTATLKRANLPTFACRK